MLKNIVLIGIRNLGKNKLFSFVNVFGLSLSMAVCLLIIAVILDQNSFDLFHPNPENTYRVNTLALRKNGGTELYASTPFPLAAILQSEHPFIAQSLRLNRSLRGSMVVGERKLTVGGYFTEPTFFAMFGFQLSGCDANVLNDPKTLIISEETA
ncbi:ABC transporter permease, partial [bacterium]|nr:ABC transporter permease [bacterium]